MAEELIDSYVDRAAIADDTKFLTDSVQSVLDILNKVSKVKITLSASKSFKEVIDGAKQAKKIIDDLEKSTEKLIKTDVEAAKVALLEAKASKELALQLKAEAQARKENAAAAKTEQQTDAAAQRAKQKREIEEIGKAYIEYSKAAREASLRAKSYALTLGESHPTTVAAVKNAKEMNDILLRVDQSVGQSQRNVGNYKSAFDGLGQSFTQISRELPSLTISVQQFALAISNNLPMLADEIAKAKTEIAALKAEGKEAPTIFQRMASAAFSFQVGLSVGIALLTAYAGKIAEFIVNMTDSEAATKRAAKQQAEYNERIDEAIRLRDKYNEEQKRQSGTEDRGIENELAYARAAGKSEVEVLKLEKALAALRQVRAQDAFNTSGGEKSLDEFAKSLRSAEYDYNQFLTKRRLSFSLADQIFNGQGSSSLSEKEIEEGKALKQEFEHQEFLFGRQKDIVEEYYNANRDAAIKDIELQKALKEQRISFFADELQYRADVLKSLSQIEDGSQGMRLNARKQALKNEKAIIEGQYQDEIIGAKNNQIKIYEINREYRFKRTKLQEEYEKDVFAIRQTALKAHQDQIAQEVQFTEEGLKEIQEKELKAEQDRIARRQNQDSLNQNAELGALNDLYERKVVSEKEYQERKLKIEKYYSLKSQTDLINDAQKLIDKAKVNGEDTIAFEKTIADIRRQIDDDLTKQLIANREQLKQKEREVAGQVIGGIQSLINDGYERQKNALQDQIDLIDVKKEKEVDAVNASLATEQEKAARIAVIDANAQIEKEKVQKKQRDIDIKKAQFDKVIGILRVGVETQSAVATLSAKAALAKAEAALLLANPVTQFAAPIAAAAAAAIVAQIPLTLASGAIQAALIAAQPIPKYKLGKPAQGKAHFGIVGDGGRQEVMYSPDLKHVFLTPATDTLAYIPKGYGIAPSIEDFHKTATAMSYGDVLPMPVIHNNNDGLMQVMAYSIGRLERAVMGKQETHFHWDNGQLQQSIKNGNDWWRYIQSNI